MFSASLDAMRSWSAARNVFGDGVDVVDDVGAGDEADVDVVDVAEDGDVQCAAGEQRTERIRRDQLRAGRVDGERRAGHVRDEHVEDRRVQPVEVQCGVGVHRRGDERGGAASTTSRRKLSPSTWCMAFAARVDSLMAWSWASGSASCTGSSAPIAERKLPGIAAASARAASRCTPTGTCAISGRRGVTPWARRERRSAPVHAASTTSLNVTPCALRTARTSSIGIEQNATERDGVNGPLNRLRGAANGSVTCLRSRDRVKPAARIRRRSAIARNARPARTGARRDPRRRRARQRHA